MSRGSTSRIIMLKRKIKRNLNKTRADRTKALSSKRKKVELCNQVTSENP